MSRACRAPLQPSKRLLALSFMTMFVALVPGYAMAAKGPRLHYQYLSPVPDAQYVSPRNNVIIRQGEPIDETSLTATRLSVTGSVSGVHSGELITIEDGRTILFKPDQPYSLGETVEVRMKPGVRARFGRRLPPLRYWFTVSTYEEGFRRQPRIDELMPALAAELAAPAPVTTDPTNPGGPDCDDCECLPENYPQVTPMFRDSPDPGYVFLTPFSFQRPTGHLSIVDERGMPMFYRSYPGGIAMDFKLQPNGMLSAFVRQKAGYVTFDRSYNEVDHCQAGNGYTADFHGIQLLANGHALVQIYDRQRVPMDRYVDGGRPDAIVTGLVIQELDADRNVIFQWRSWDHMEFTDLTSPSQSLTDSIIDWVHGNAVEATPDGNILICSRHLNEVTKIDRQTGDIIWRLGLLAKNNDFTFVNDTRGFSHPHDARMLPNGHVTLFDNGVLLDPEYSRGLEYEIDEVNKTATLVRETRNTPDVYAGFMGSMQLRENGGVTIGWGGAIGPPGVSEFHADGSKALDLALPPRFTSYRAFRFVWETDRFVTDVETLDFGACEVGSTRSLPVHVRNNMDSDLEINCIERTDTAFEVRTGVPLTIPPGAEETIQVQFRPGQFRDYDGKVYLRQVSEDELVARAVAVHGIGVSGEKPPGREEPSPVDVAEGAPAFALFANQPNPVRNATLIRFALPRDGVVSLEILDVRGRRVDTLVDGPLPAGVHRVSWEAGDSPSGLYFYRLQFEDRVESKKFVLMR